MRNAIRHLLERRFPGCVVEDVRRLGADEAQDDVTTKGTGYGEVLRIALRAADGARRTVVFHTARADDFGHDRRSDRMAELLLAFDSYGQLPQHVAALDVGLIGHDGALCSLSTCGEPYLLTSWADGEPYATDLRRVAADGAGPRDRHRCDVLVDYLVALHVRHSGRLAEHTRAVRDLLGSGEGIFGIVDGYPDDVPGAPRERLESLEAACLRWRWRLRGFRTRIARTHGDFHPFNVLFHGDDELALLDASRGACGDPADDVAAMAINYVFFALDAPGAWARGLGPLWHRFWTRYLRSTSDRELLEVVPPWLAWRALVLANPRWYPGLSARGRDALLGWIERTLAQPRFDPATADEVCP
jgi:hypothetical protein